MRGGRADYGSINRAVNKYRQEWVKKHINLVHNGQPILPKWAQNTESKSNNQILHLFPVLIEVPAFAVIPDISWKIPLTRHNQASVHVVEITGS